MTRAKTTLHLSRNCCIGMRSPNANWLRLKLKLGAHFRIISVEEDVVINHDAENTVSAKLLNPRPGFVGIAISIKDPEGNPLMAEDGDVEDNETQLRDGRASLKARLISPFGWRLFRSDGSQDYYTNRFSLDRRIVVNTASNAFKRAKRAFKVGKSVNVPEIQKGWLLGGEWGSEPDAEGLPDGVLGVLENVKAKLQEMLGGQFDVDVGIGKGQADIQDDNKPTVH